MADHPALKMMRAIRHAEIEPPMRKYVLLMLATYANPDGTEIFPGLRNVAEATGLDLRTVRKHVRACQDAGYLVRTTPSRQHHKAGYRLDLDALREGASVPPDDLREGAVALREGAVASERGRQCTPTYKDLNLPGAPPASPAGGQAGGALPKTVPGSLRQGVSVVAANGTVKLSVPTRFMRECLQENHLAEIADHYGVDPGAVQFVS